MASCQSSTVPEMDIQHQNCQENQPDGSLETDINKEKHCDLLTKTVQFNTEKAPDYDDESGVYLGPGRAFDDEVLEYLSKSVEEQMNLLEKDESPPSPLLVDSVSGIYLGFDDPMKDEEDDEEGDEEQDNELKTDEILDQGNSQSKTVWDFFRIKQSSKYKVNSDGEVSGNNCFRFIRKVWRKAEICP